MSLGSYGFVRVRHWGSLVHSGAPLESLGSSAVVGFTLVRPGCRWIHAGSLRSLQFTLGFIGFMRCRWLHSGSPRWMLAAFGVAGLRPGGRWVYPETVG